MSFFQEDNVITGNVILTWDGLRHPQERSSGSLNYNVSVLIPQNAPEVAELESIAKACLAKSDLGAGIGMLPAGALWPLGKPADPVKFGAEYTNYLQISAGSSRGIPKIVDINGNELTSMVYGPMLYPGCIMRLIVNAWPYTTINKGISFGLQGLQIVDATAPQLAVGGGLSAGDMASAFGGSPVQSVPATPSVAPPAVAGATIPAASPGVAPPAPPVAPATDFVPQKIMSPTATGKYEDYVKAGWTDEQMIAAGFLVG